MRFYWEPPCQHHEFDRPACILCMISPIWHMPAIIIHPDMGIFSLEDWQQRWEQPDSRIWCNGGVYKVDDFVKHYLVIKDVTKSALHRIAIKKSNSSRQAIVYMDEEFNRVRFVATGEFCIDNKPNHDVLIKIPPAYSF